MNVRKSMLAALAAGSALLGGAGAIQAAPYRAYPTQNTNVLPRRFEAALESLRLSPEQRSRIAGYTRDGQGRARDVRRDKSLSPAQRQDRLRSQRRDLRDSIVKNILSPGQRARLARIEGSGPRR